MIYYLPTLIISIGFYYLQHRLRVPLEPVFSDAELRNTTKIDLVIWIVITVVVAFFNFKLLA